MDTGTGDAAQPYAESRFSLNARPLGNFLEPLRVGRVARAEPGHS
jgi:hypothetical protein